jgi:hypothetical protein
VLGVFGWLCVCVCVCVCVCLWRSEGRTERVEKSKENGFFFLCKPQTPNTPNNVLGVFGGVFFFM